MRERDRELDRREGKINNNNNKNAKRGNENMEKEIEEKRKKTRWAGERKMRNIKGRQSERLEMGV